PVPGGVRPLFMVALNERGEIKLPTDSALGRQILRFSNWAGQITIGIRVVMKREADLFAVVYAPSSGSGVSRLPAPDKQYSGRQRADKNDNENLNDFPHGQPPGFETEMIIFYPIIPKKLGQSIARFSHFLLH